MAGDINPISFLKLFRMNRPVLAKMTLIAGCLQIAHEGKSVQPLFFLCVFFRSLNKWRRRNTADVHQAYSKRDVGMGCEHDRL